MAKPKMVIPKSSKTLFYVINLHDQSVFTRETTYEMARTYAVSQSEGGCPHAILSVIAFHRGRPDKCRHGRLAAEIERLRS